MATPRDSQAYSPVPLSSTLGFCNHLNCTLSWKMGQGLEKITGLEHGLQGLLPSTAHGPRVLPEMTSECGLGENAGQPLPPPAPLAGGGLAPPLWAREGVLTLLPPPVGIFTLIWV